jgi:hypothetical protein
MTRLTQERTLINLNLQPVIPFTVTSSWKLILRTIVPINRFPAADGERDSHVSRSVVHGAP